MILSRAPFTPNASAISSPPLSARNARPGRESSRLCVAHSAASVIIQISPKKCRSSFRANAPSASAITNAVAATPPPVRRTTLLVFLVMTRRQAPPEEHRDDQREHDHFLERARPER